MHGITLRICQTFVIHSESIIQINFTPREVTFSKHSKPLLNLNKIVMQIAFIDNQLCNQDKASKYMTHITNEKQNINKRKRQIEL